MTFQSLADAKAKLDRKFFHSSDTYENLCLNRDYEALKPSDIYYIFVPIARDDVAAQVESDKKSEVFKARWKELSVDTLRESFKGTYIPNINAYTGEEMYNDCISLIITDINAAATAKKSRGKMMKMGFNIIDEETSDSDQDGSTQDGSDKDNSDDDSNDDSDYSDNDAIVEN